MNKSNWPELILETVKICGPISDTDIFMAHLDCGWNAKKFREIVNELIAQEKIQELNDEKLIIAPKI